MLEHFEILELEEKWEKYNSSKKKGFCSAFFKEKSYMFDKTIIFLLIVISIIFGVIVWILTSNNKNTNMEKINLNKNLQINNVEKVTDKISNTQQAIETNTSSANENKVLEQNNALKINNIGIDSSNDSGGFILNNQYIDTEEEKSKSFSSIPKDEIIDFGNPPLPPKNSLKNTANKNFSAKPLKDRLVIETTKLNESKESLKDKFYATNNIVYSLMLSEQAYESKNYEEAIKWALISNDINKDNAKSWILFAKSKYKLSFKKDALIALEAYNNRLPNREVQDVILRIKNGDL